MCARISVRVFVCMCIPHIFQMAGGIDLAEVQDPSPNATVSWWCCYKKIFLQKEMIS